MSAPTLHGRDHVGNQGIIIQLHAFCRRHRHHFPGDVLDRLEAGWVVEKLADPQPHDPASSVHTGVRNRLGPDMFRDVRGKLGRHAAGVQMLNDRPRHCIGGSLPGQTAEIDGGAAQRVRQYLPRSRQTAGHPQYALQDAVS